VIAPEGPKVLNVNVALPPPLVTFTGLVLPNEQLACDGVNVTVDVTAHERVTLPA
jgi:hypothetical protein